jgi:MFS family permease
VNILSKSLVLRAILFFEHLAFYLSFPSIAVLALDETHGLLTGSEWMSQRVLLYGLLVTLYPFLQIFAAPLVGKRLDEHSKKTVLQIIHLGGIIGYLLIATAALTQNFLFAVLGLSISSVLGAPLPVVKALIAIYTDKAERLREFAKIAQVKSVSSVIGPFLGLWIVNVVPEGWQYVGPLGISAFLAFGGLVLTNRLIPSSEGIPSGVSSITPVLPPLAVLKEQAPLLLALFCFAGGYCTFLKFIPVVWSGQFGTELFVFSSFSALVGFSNTLNQMIIGRWLHLSFEWVPFYAKILCGGLLFLSIFSVTFFSWIGLFLILFCYAFLITSTEVQLSLLGAETTQGRIQGMLYSIENSSYLVGPAIGALLASVQPAYALYFIFGIAAISLFLVHSASYLNVYSKNLVTNP